MTTFRARRAKRFDPRLDAIGRRVLCGRAEGGKFCPNVIAWIIDYSPGDGMPPGQTGEVWINHGLTDDGTPGRYRWSTTARERLAHGRTPDILGTAQGKGGRFARGPRRVRVPIALPCPKDHENVVDEAVLNG